MARLIGGIILLALIVAAVLLTWPQLAGIARYPGIAQAVALRGLLVAGAAALVVVLLVLSILIRPARGFLAGAIIIVCLFAAANAAIVYLRGITDTSLPAAQDGQITVLAWNTEGDAVSAETIATLAVEQGADVIALPETTNGHALEVAARLADKGSPMTTLTLDDGSDLRARSTSLLVSAALGEYRQDPDAGGTAVVPSLVAVPVSGQGPRIVAAHAVSPTATDLGSWNSDLDWIASQCAVPGTIIAGDFNATVDHLGDQHGCTDAAEAEGVAGVATWPTDLPALLGAPIDHVMTTQGWAPVAASVVTRLDAAGSDHRPIVATVAATA